MSRKMMTTTLAETLDVSQAAAARGVEALLDLIAQQLRDTGSFTVMGWGAYKVRPTAARTGRNPRTNEPVEIPAGMRVTFRAADPLKAAVTPPPPAKKTARKKAA